MKYYLLTFLFGFFVLLSACTAEPNQSQKTPLTIFFDLKEFVKKQNSELGLIPMTKTVTINDSIKTLAQDSVNWKQEFSALENSNINLPALWDKYQVDTINQGNTSFIHYHAIDNKVKTQSLLVKYRKGEIYQIEVKNNKKSPIAKTKEKITWTPNSYLVENIQEAVLLDERRIKIESVW